MIVAGPSVARSWPKQASNLTRRAHSVLPSTFTSNLIGGQGFSGSYRIRTQTDGTPVRPSATLFQTTQTVIGGMESTGRHRTFATSTPHTVHPLDPLTGDEIKAASSIVRSFLGLTPDNSVQQLRFVSVSLVEPPKKDYLAGKKTPRSAEIVALNPTTGLAAEYKVDLEEGEVSFSKDLPKGVQPLLTPEDCDLAEAIVQSSPEMAAIMKERYGITDMSTVACDPWSVHLANDSDREMTFWRSDGVPGRLVQTFLYQRMYGEGMEGNVYSHPIDIVPVVDLNARKVVTVNGMNRPPPKIPTASVQYHRNLVSTNTYLESEWRQEKLAALDIVQPDGPSFTVDGQEVEWQKWKFRVGFNYREGLVLHDVTYEGRPIMHRGSLVEMAVPYADPHPPYQRKCAFDIGDYGLGYCANSLELGCDCLGHIHYFDATLSDSQGQPVEKKKVVCMHEEDNGILWKHVEYRNGHGEARRGRELVISSIATVVNYEYLFYWHLRQDGCIDYKIKLSGELSTNLLSEGEDKPTHGVMVAPGVNSQIHQHMFCARLDMAVDSHKNTVTEMNMYTDPPSESNPYGNGFNAKETILGTELDAKRVNDANTARYWKVSNAEGKVNKQTGKPVAYKLHAFNFGPSHPILLTDPNSAVSKKGAFANYHLWVTPHSDTERYPAGEYTVQGTGSNGLPDWTAANRNIVGEDIVLWHAFGVTHVPRPEDFPVMPCEVTGFTLKPDGFFEGNPAIDIQPEVNKASTLTADSSGGCCGTTTTTPTA